MHPRSDIAGLFSKLDYRTEHYQEIATLSKLEQSSSRWALLQEVHHAISAAQRSAPRQA